MCCIFFSICSRRVANVFLTENINRPYASGDLRPSPVSMCLFVEMHRRDQMVYRLDDLPDTDHISTPGVNWVQAQCWCVRAFTVPLLSGLGSQASREQHAQREETAELTAERHRDTAGRRHGGRGATPGLHQLLLTLGPGSADPHTRTS